MRQAIRLLPLLLLALGARPAAAESGSMDFLCYPSALGAAMMRDYGLEPADTWQDERGFMVERWAGPGGAEAVLIVLPADNGTLLRCPLLGTTPPEKP